MRERDELEDSVLVGMTLSGDLMAYETLVRRYQKLVYNALHQMVRLHEAAADLTQDTFLKSFRSLKSFKKEARFKPWLLRIATNSGLNWLRDNRRETSLDCLLEESPQNEPVAADDVERSVDWEMSQSRLCDALDELPPRHRYVFVLRYQHDLPYEDIAQIMSEPETTIKSLLFRTRARLKRILGTGMARDRETSDDG